MHNLKKFGSTWMKIKLKKYDNIKNVIRFKNQFNNDKMDNILAKTILGFTKIVKKINPDLIIIHGDRIEPLACASVGALNNFKIGHIEGGEVSGTVDEILRHSISKLAHIHFTSNKKAKRRLIQMGELKENIFVIGSPDLDIMESNSLPSISEVKKHYEIKYNNYAVVILHSVTTDLNNFKNYVKIFVNCLIKSRKNYVIIYPNNDNGSDIIFEEYKKLKKLKNFRMLPSMRFEYYLTMLKNSNFIIGNSSSGIIEAPFYGVPTINLGNRQNKRSTTKTIKNLDFIEKKILNLINIFFKKKIRYKVKNEFGEGKSFRLFEKVLKTKKIWEVKSQKTFKDLNLN